MKGETDEETIAERIAEETLEARAEQITVRDEVKMRCAIGRLITQFQYISLHQ